MTEPELGKKSDRIDGWTPVVAGALARADGTWLMHRRPLSTRHGGLWEFPGGKLERGETPVNALIREIREELGICIAAPDCEPLAFAEEQPEASSRPIVLFLYKITAWIGEPAALEGGEVGWFDPIAIKELEKPPLDVALVRRMFEKA